MYIYIYIIFFSTSSIYAWLIGAKNSEQEQLTLQDSMHTQYVHSLLSTKLSGSLESKQSKLGDEAQSDNKPSSSLGNDASLKPSNEDNSSSSLESEDSSLKRNKCDDKPSGSLKSDDSLLKQSKLGGEAKSNTKPSGSQENDDASLKQSGMEDMAQQSSSLESDGASLKQSTGEQTAKKKRRGVLDSMSKLVKKIIPFKQRGKDSTGKHA